MTTGHPHKSPIDAGEFGAWLIATTRGTGGEVPCGDCNACCRGSYFIHVTPEDTAAREAIPAELLFDAPGLPGHRVLGYNERGECPMLQDGACSIYAARPQTCRRYDCRVFAATGLTTGDARKADVDARVSRWVFDATTEHAREQLEQARLVAAFLQSNPKDLPADFVPRNNTQLAVLALQLCHAIDLERWPAMTNKERADALVNAGAGEPP